MTTDETDSMSKAAWKAISDAHNARERAKRAEQYRAQADELATRRAWPTDGRELADAVLALLLAADAAVERRAYDRGYHARVRKEMIRARETKTNTRRAPARRRRTP